MPTFRYTARDMHGEKHVGVRAADTEDQLAERLREEGQFLVDADERRTSDDGNSSSRARKSRQKVKAKRRDIILFSRHLATCLEGGIPILQALQTMEEDPPGSMGPVIRDVREQIRGGSTLSDAMSRHPKVFNELYVSLVAAGEEAGRVGPVLDELAEYLEWQEELVAEIRRLTVYPSVIVTALILLLTLLFKFVLPRLLGTIQEMNVEMALPTRVLIGVSDFMAEFWYLMPLALGLVFAAFYFGGRLPGGQYMIDWLKLRLPVAGELFRKIALSRFAHNLSVQYNAGIGILRSLEVVEKTVGNVVIGNALRQARERIRMGGSLSDGLRETGEFPGMVLQLVTVGETTGSLDRSLQTVSDFYDREVPQTVERVFGYLEPALIIILGVIIGGVAVGVYLPIYNLIDQIGGM